MKQIAVSKFKATCLALLQRVSKTGQPLLITKKGQPLAQVISPPPRKGDKKTWLGSCSQTAELTGNLIEPVAPQADWDIYKK